MELTGRLAPLLRCAHPVYHRWLIPPKALRYRAAKCFSFPCLNERPSWSCRRIWCCIYRLCLIYSNYIKLRHLSSTVAPVSSPPQMLDGGVWLAAPRTEMLDSSLWWAWKLLWSGAKMAEYARAGWRFIGVWPNMVSVRCKMQAQFPDLLQRSHPVYFAQA